MKKLILVSSFVFFSSVISQNAQAENLVNQRNAQNLKDVVLCIGEVGIRVGDEIGDNVSRDFSKELYQQFKNKLTAYRIPYLENCSSSFEGKFAVAYLNFYASKPAQNSNIRMVENDLQLYVSGVSNYPDGMNIYQLNSSSLITNYDNNQIRQLMKSELATFTDVFAADYAKANP